MGKIENSIKDILIKNFDPFVLSVVNESSMHNVPQGSESHFKVLIVSDDFKNINNIKRHQTVYKALQSVMQSIHALSINTFDKKEFQKNPKLIDSPKCVNKINES